MTAADLEAARVVVVEQARAVRRAYDADSMHLSLELRRLFEAVDRLEATR